MYQTGKLYQKYKIAVSQTYRTFFFKKIKINFLILPRYVLDMYQYQIRIGQDTSSFINYMGFRD